MNRMPTQAPSSLGRPSWYAIDIRDPELTSAASFGRLVARASRFVAFAAVTMSELEAVPGIPPEMEKTGDRLPILSQDAFLDSVRSLTQFVYGRFLFYSDLATAEKAYKAGGFLEYGRFK